ncbi:helix-turn-helix domain-containing protein [Dyadobacter koreensis]|uniref:helix-turn-helix domain-containing protein n=1 Tax=Dyadobacter koreensis TaxID=408657 RepID=UPI0015A605CB|nr:helix-turn-helix transcriptional regulator [Dyadobacter koreensis]
MEKELPRSLSVYPTVHFLSRKEREVLVLVAMGMTSKEISIKLDVLPKSIDNYKNRITKKLGVWIWCTGSFCIREQGFAS